jgi:hypothetical protein
MAREGVLAAQKKENLTQEGPVMMSDSLASVSVPDTLAYVRDMAVQLQRMCRQKSLAGPTGAFQAVLEEVDQALEEIGKH